MIWATSARSIESEEVAMMRFAVAIGAFFGVVLFVTADVALAAEFDDDLGDLEGFDSLD